MTAQTPSLTWTCKPFQQLSAADLYAILRLRAEVFVVEQNCPYQDLDNNDQQALHLGGFDGEELACYVRLLPPGLKYTGASIGRVVTAMTVRGTGIGRELMREALRNCEQRWPGVEITISAQHHLEKFYASLGFGTVSEPYMEDDIPHIEMTRR